MTDEEYWKLGTDKLEELVAGVDAIVETFPEPRRAQVRKMLDGKVGEQFYLAPASSRRKFHACYPAGLMEHSLGVVKNALALSKALFPGRWPDWKVSFCALFHDIGKAGPAGKPYYVPTKEKWKRERGDYYSVDQNEWQPSSERGLYILQSEGITLDFEETMAIRLNDGAGPDENKPYSFRQPRLSLIIHWADHWASLDEKEKDREFTGTI